ncbi:ABC transporter permease, partial [Streptomyces sp. WM6386]
MSTSVTAPPAKNTAPRLRTPRKKHASGKPKRNVLLTALMALMVLYTVVPLIWLVINSTKTQAGLADSNGLWFAHDFALWDNIRDTFTYHDGIFGRWLLNTLLYVVLGAGGATLLAVLGGYALAKFDLPGKRAIFAVVIGAVA